ncbi:MAG: hypothetical protein JW969_06355 [Spirochaetales bacterium]|nr:hypothetical protein [Spirochaetales bacterium]
MTDVSYINVWKKLYPHGDEALTRLTGFLEKQKRSGSFTSTSKQWYKEGTIYCVYPDAFDGSIKGLTNRIDYLVELGVSIIWLLPSLESPGKDQGFDISDYYRIAGRHGGNEAFREFIEAAHKAGLKVIFDIAINHTSDEHPWFKEGSTTDQSLFRAFYHWQPDAEHYPDAQPIFPDSEDSLWTWHPSAKAYYLHFFYCFQPDLNYANPEVALEMIKVLTFWKAFGVDGFRMDAAPYLWKEEGTDCVNRPRVHLILKLFRACLDFLAPGSLFLAESNLPSHQLVEYFGDDNECQAAYHFPLVPVFYEALYHRDPAPLIHVPFHALPPGGQYFTFLRCHDEVPLDYVSPEKRQDLLSCYAPEPNTRFRGGHGFSGRLFELMGRNPEKTLAAWSLLLSMPGTPVLYYGDEVAMENNRDFYEKKCKETGVFDSRFLHRGPWRRNEKYADAVLTGIQEMLCCRKENPEIFAAAPQLEARGPVLISRRHAGNNQFLIMTNLAGDSCMCDSHELPPYGRVWEFIQK